MTIEQVTKCLVKDPGTTRWLLSEMAKSGQFVKRVKRGVYTNTNNTNINNDTNTANNTNNDVCLLDMTTDKAFSTEY